MDDIPLGLLLAVLVILLILSAFFSGSETAMMALNRYRLRHLVRARHPGAERADRLLRRPDRLIGLVLLGNNFVNILASAIVTVLALRLWGDEGIAPAAAALTVVVLLFSEVLPKTLAALRPERIAFPAAFPLGVLMWVLLPVVVAINAVGNGLLRILGVSAARPEPDRLSRDELRTMLYESAVHMPSRHRGMLLRIMDLEQVSVEDVMVPRNEVEGLDLDADHDVLVERLTAGTHTRLPVYRTSLDRLEGVLNVRRVAHLLSDPDRLLAELSRHLEDPYFVPERTALTQQVLKFQDQHRRLALVVDEYGDTVGLVTVEDILREIVGEVIDKPGDVGLDVRPQPDGSFLVDGGVNLRELARRTGWDLPTDAAKTLNGAILEHLQNIPAPATSVLLAGYPVEIVQVSGNAVRTARISPHLRREPRSNANGG